MLYSATTTHATTQQQPAWLIVLLLLSALAIADNRELILPDSYRTPMSDLVYEAHPTWRAAPKDDNGWRRKDESMIPDKRFKTEILPLYDYEYRDDPTMGNMFMNENELAKPKTNIFRFNF